MEEEDPGHVNVLRGLCHLYRQLPSTMGPRAI
jgi:hypothetical protein